MTSPDPAVTATPQITVPVVPRTVPLAKRLSRLSRRIGFGLLCLRFAVESRIAPQRAVTAAARLWCRPPSNAGRRKDSRPSVGTQWRITDPDGRQLAVESWGEGPTVLLVHGWGGWRGQLGALVTPLVEAGYRVVGYDSLSHGESDPGEFGSDVSTGGELTRCVQAVAAEVGPITGMVAHSLGCAAAVRAHLAGVNVDWLTLIAPNPDLRPEIEGFAARLKLPRRLTADVAGKVAEMARTGITDFALVDLMAGRTLPPTLIVHDLRDKECTYRTSAVLAERIDAVELITTDGLGHQRILTNTDVAATIARWAGGIERTKRSSDSSTSR